MNPSLAHADYRPDFDRFVAQIGRTCPPGPVPLAEYLVDWPIIENVTGVKLAFDGTGGDLAKATLDRIDREQVLESAIESTLGFCKAVGLDYLPVELGAGLLTYRGIPISNGDTGGHATWWYLDPDGVVKTWDDLEQFYWPTEVESDYTLLDKACHLVPEGMKVVVKVEGVFENASGLMGMTTFFTALYDNPDLVNTIVDRVIDILARQIIVAVQHAEVGAIWMGDDLGFNSGTFIRPDTLRKTLFPGYARLIDITHRAGRFFFLHSCGNLAAIMNDLISLHLDAKHSFEDKIMPVEEVYRQWGSQIGILGGLDMDLLARGTQSAVRNRTREILDVCGPLGGYALGTGNSVADYVPLDNYLAMVDEGLRWNIEHFGLSH